MHCSLTHELNQTFNLMLHDVMLMLFALCIQMYIRTVNSCDTDGSRPSTGNIHL